jgi:hypothetical protein
MIILFRMGAAVKPFKRPRLIEEKSEDSTDKSKKTDKEDDQPFKKRKKEEPPHDSGIVLQKLGTLLIRTARTVKFFPN